MTTISSPRTTKFHQQSFQTKGEAGVQPPSHSTKATVLNSSPAASPSAAEFNVTLERQLGRFVGVYESTGPNSTYRFLRITKSGAGDLRLEFLKQLDQTSYRVWGFKHVNEGAQVETFAKYENQGDGTLTSRTSLTGRALKQQQIKDESWGWEALLGATPERSIQNRSVELLGDQLSVCEERTFFHRAFVLSGPYSRPFTAPGGNTIAPDLSLYRRISNNA